MYHSRKRSSQAHNDIISCELVSTPLCLPEGRRAGGGGVTELFLKEPVFWFLGNILMTEEITAAHSGASSRRLWRFQTRWRSASRIC